MLVMIVGLVIFGRGQNLPNLSCGTGWSFAIDLISMPSTTPRSLSLEATQSFQEIFQEEFGEVLSDDEAQHRGVQLLRFFDMVARPDSDNAKSPR